MFKFILKLIGKHKEVETKKRPLMIAHRGARKVAPENTLEAFRKAIKLGFDGVEFDVVITKDKVPIVFHGNDLSLITRAKGLIHEMLYEDIAKIDAGSLFDPKYAGEKIPRLEEALALLQDSSMFLNVEIKSQPRGHNGIEPLVADLIKKYGLQNRVLVSSFSPLILRRFRKIAPEIPASLLVGPNPFFFLKTLLSVNMLRVSAINPVFQYTSEALVLFAKEQKYRVYVWNVNTRQEYARAIELGVDGIITDEPELLKLG